MAQKQGSNITPIKLGLKFTPPSLVLIYNDKSKLRSRTIPVKELDILTELDSFTSKFKANEKYRKYFDKIGEKKLEKQFFILQDYMKGYTLSESLIRAKKYDDGELLNKTKSDIDDDTEDDKKSEDNDFKDTDDEDDKKPNPFGKTATFTTATLNLNKTTTATSNAATNSQQQSKSSALDLLSTQLKTVKASLFDFEEDVDDEVKTDDDDDDDEDNLNKNTKKATKPEEKFELPKHDDSSEDSSF